MTETPRTWTQTEWSLYQHDLNDETAMLDRMPDDRLIEVIEKAPVDAERERLLALLKRAAKTLSEGYKNDPVLEADIDAALREYGRLGKEES